MSLVFLWLTERRRVKVIFFKNSFCFSCRFQNSMIALTIFFHLEICWNFYMTFTSHCFLKMILLISFYSYSEKYYYKFYHHSHISKSILSWWSLLIHFSRISVKIYLKVHSDNFVKLNWSARHFFSINFLRAFG